MLIPPADRVAGRRGARGVLAFVASVGALVPLVGAANADDPAWTQPGYVAATLALTLAAAVLWVARRPLALGLGVALVLVTVEHHVSAVPRKLRLSNRHQISRWATERRLVE